MEDCNFEISPESSFSLRVISVAEILELYDVSDDSDDSDEEGDEDFHPVAETPQVMRIR